MPQIAQLAATYTSQIFWLLLTFGFVFFVVGRGMVPKVQSTLDLREKKVRDDIAAAKASSDRADALEADWRAKENADRAAARDIITQATAAATLDNERRFAEADKAIADKIAAAEALVEQSRSAALADIEAVAAEAAAQMAERVAGARVSQDAANQAVKAAMAHG